jgi:hypothetical protein
VTAMPDRREQDQATTCFNGARRLERCITRDAKVPMFDDDREMDHSWRCIPVPPDDRDGWFILDSSRDYKTEWGRWGDVAESTA